jgi:hypothetical protein
MKTKAFTWILTLFFVLPLANIQAQKISLGSVLKKGAETIAGSKKEEPKPADKKADTPQGKNQQTENKEAAIIPHLTASTKVYYIDSYALDKRFSDGLLCVLDIDKNKYGFIDETATVKIDFKWNTNFIGYPRFNGGYCVLHSNEGYNKRWYIVDRNGKETILPKEYTQVSPFCEGRATVLDYTGGKLKVIFIDHTGKQIFPNLARSPKFSPGDPDMPRTYQEGLAAFYDTEAEKWGFHDKTGKLVIPAIFEEVNDFSEGLAGVKFTTTDGSKGKWGFIDKTGKTIIEPKFTKQPTQFSEGFAVVEKQNGKYCAINNKGEVVSPEYPDLSPFYEGFAFAKTISSTIVIDKNFNQVKTIKTFSIPRIGVKFFDGLAAVGSNGKVDDIRGRIINPQGETVIASEGTNASIGNFFDGLAHCYARINGVYIDGFINKKGEYVFMFKKNEF